MNEVEAAFEKTTKILFGSVLSPLGRYEKWLRRNTPGGRFIKNPDGSCKVFLPNFSMFQFVPEKAAAGLEAMNENSKKKLNIIQFDFFAIGRDFARSLLVCEFIEGQNTGIKDCNWYLNCQHIYKNAYCFYAKYCAYNLWSSFTDHVFGCYRNMNSNFCINCYFSSDLNRCFEMDSCRACGDSMFCHNCENVYDSIFCFNVKNKRYAVANVEVGRENFLAIKKNFLQWALSELDSKADLTLNIYNVLCRH